MQNKFENLSLVEGIALFTDATVNGDRSDDEIEALAESLMVRHCLSQESLVQHVYSRLLMLARFCQCSSGMVSNTRESDILAGATH